jgi:hypothetical protein
MKWRIIAVLVLVAWHARSEEPAKGAADQPRAARGHNPMLHQQGTRIVDEQGKEVKLRGVNLGGWLVWEGWIFGKGVLTSQTTILTRLEKAVGAQQTEEFRTQVYDNFIAEADI